MHFSNASSQLQGVLNMVLIILFVAASFLLWHYALRVIQYYHHITVANINRMAATTIPTVLQTTTISLVDDAEAALNSFYEALEEGRLVSNEVTLFDTITTDDDPGTAGNQDNKDYYDVEQPWDEELYTKTGVTSCLPNSGDMSDSGTRGKHSYSNSTNTEDDNSKMYPITSFCDLATSFRLHHYAANHQGFKRSAPSKHHPAPSSCTSPKEEEDSLMEYSDIESDSDIDSWGLLSDDSHTPGTKGYHYNTGDEDYCRISLYA